MLLIVLQAADDYFRVAFLSVICSFGITNYRVAVGLLVEQG